MRGTYLSLIVVAMTVAQTVRAQPAVRYHPLPSAAQSLALANLRTVPEHEQRYMRYVWIRQKSIADLMTTSVTINGTSQAVRIARPRGVRDGDVMLARIDLRDYVSPDEKYERLATTWEEYRNDPAFSLLLTPDVLRAITRAFGEVKLQADVYHWEKELVDCPEYIHPQDGKRYTQRWEKRRVKYRKVIHVGAQEQVELIRLPSPMLDLAVHEELVRRTHSEAPVVSQPYWTFRANRSIREDGVYKEVWGGLYVELLNLPQGKGGASDEDALFHLLGVGDGTAGSAARVYARTRSDQRTAKFRSGVTGRSRVVEVLPTLFGQPSSTMRILSVSHDVEEKDIDLGRHAMYNLLNPKDRARELIYNLRNGMHGYDLVNNVGKRQQEVPIQIATDRGVPEPDPPRLQMSISCKDCHEGKNKNDGWIPTGNDVQRLVKRLGGFDVLADLSRGNDPQLRTAARLAELYGGDPDAAFRAGRDKYHQAVFSAVGAWVDDKVDLSRLVEVVIGNEVRIARTYWYKPVSAEVALREFGIELLRKEDRDRAADVLAWLLRPNPKDAVPLVELGGRVVIPENVTLAGLTAGLDVTRAEFDLVYQIGLHRVARNLDEFRRAEAAGQVPAMQP